MAHSDILSQPDRGLGLDRPQTEALLALFLGAGGADAALPLTPQKFARSLPGRQSAKSLLT